MPAIAVTCISRLAAREQEIHRADTRTWGGLARSPGFSVPSGAAYRNRTDDLGITNVFLLVVKFHDAKVEPPLRAAAPRLPGPGLPSVVSVAAPPSAGAAVTGGVRPASSALQRPWPAGVLRGQFTGTSAGSA